MIRKRFIKLSLKLHPDRSGSDGSDFVMVSEAYGVLSDVETRREYDPKHPTHGTGVFNPDDDLRERSCVIFYCVCVCFVPRLCVHSFVVVNLI